MKKRILKGLSVLLGTAVACETYYEPAYGVPEPDYGTSYMQFRYDLQGTVTDAGTGDPIPDAKVVFEGSSDTTKADGSWSIEAWLGDPCGDDCQVVAQDVDGDDNGSYQDSTADIDPQAADTGDADFVQHDIAIEMEPN